MLSLGSSPRVRGRPGGGGRVDAVPGLIPAGAGQTTARRRIWSPVKAHPRGCGADSHPRDRTDDRQGSSPRVRGRLQLLRHQLQLLRLIPAGAGQTIIACLLCASCGAHPRGCGADWRGPTMRRTGSGSSPRVRGRPPRAAHFKVHTGLIPAGAGQTCASSSHAAGESAHPRGCGADSSLVSAISSPLGSSPRVRGRRDEDPDCRDGCGLIPAGAGQTPALWWTTTHSTAHPRGCGADSNAVGKTAHWQGSSPRVRGRLVPRTTHGVPHGLIPAGAGQTQH